MPQLSTNKGVRTIVYEGALEEKDVENGFSEMLEDTSSEISTKKPIDEKQSEKTEIIENFQVVIETPKSSVIDVLGSTLISEKSPEQIMVESQEMGIFELIKDIANGYLDNQVTVSKDTFVDVSEKGMVALNNVVNAVEPLLSKMEISSLEKLTSVGGQENEIAVVVNTLEQGIKELKKGIFMVPVNVDTKSTLGIDRVNQLEGESVFEENENFNSKQVEIVIEQMQEVSDKISSLFKGENVSIAPKDFGQLVRNIEEVMSSVMSPMELNEKTKPSNHNQISAVLVKDYQLFSGNEDSKLNLESLLSNDATEAEAVNNTLLRSNPLKKESTEVTTMNHGSEMVTTEIDNSIVAKETSDVWKVTGKGEKIQEMSLPELKQNISGKIEQLQQIMIGKDRMLVQINPKNLGVVDLYFKKEGGKVQLTVEFEKPETKQKIEALIDDIRKEFKDKNLEVNYVFKERERSEKEESKQRKNEKQQLSRNHEEESFESMIKETIGGISNA